MNQPVVEEGASWISLGAAAAMLGVSESTVRRWVDAGEVRSFRTRGGHRRIHAADLNTLVTEAARTPARDAGHVSEVAIARVRRRLNRRPSESLAALDALSESARMRLRLLGRHLVDLFAHYTTTKGRRERFLEDARTIGHEYGRLMVEEGLRLSQAITVFNSFRRSLEEAASQIATEAGLSTEEAVEAVESLLQLADVVLETMAEQYESS